MYAKVIVDIAHTDVDRLFSYRIPEGMTLEAGQRVLVPFGAGNRATEAFVLELEEEAPSGAYQIKSILRPLDPYSALLGEQIALAYWMRETYHCVLADALRLMIPAELRGGRVREKRIRTVALAEGVDERALALLRSRDGGWRAPKQGAVMELMLQYKKPMAIQDLCAFIPGASSAIGALVKKGFLEEEGHSGMRSPLAGMAAEKSRPVALTEAQRHALEALCEGLARREGVFLLHGITGSGKTEVYMQAMERALAEGGGAIVLVPEIALTPQTVARFKGRFGERVALMHSRLSAGERYDEWRRIRSGVARVVIGARSAVFAPVENLRLIVIDEEHEQSYISEITPRYSAVETAAKRAKLTGAVLLLGSATPSLLSYYRAKRGRYTLLELPQRVGDAVLPETRIVDMRSEFLNGNMGIFSAALAQALGECIGAGEKAILFINRRGYSTFVSCRSCGYVFRCPNCDISLTYHKYGEKGGAGLHCHYCGYRQKQPSLCPSCGKPYIKFFGVGTQQVEEALYRSFPGVEALRMDMDTTRGKNAHDELLRRFAHGSAQVLIGTQMIAKGLDIPSLTLVGVVAADAALHIPDYRSAERTFQLTMQVAGRAGRGDKKGLAIIQSYTPEHPAIALAAAHDYAAFYELEMQARRQGMFPPFALFVRLLFTGEDETALLKRAEACAEALRPLLRGAIEQAGGDARELLMLYASPAPVARRQGLFRFQVLVKLARTKSVQAALDALYAFMQAGDYAHIPCHMEINPLNLF